MEQLERRIEGLRRENERRRAAVERLGEELAETRRSLENARTGIDSRDRRLEAADETLRKREKELKALGTEFERERLELTEARARLELREEELERTRAAVGEAQGELVSLRERLAERERDLEARVRELGQAGEELVGRQRELEAVGTLLETQGAELARSRDALTEAREATQAAERERDEARARLEVRERHLDNAKQGIEARDRRLEVADRKLKAADRTLRSRDAELDRSRVSTRERERKLALVEGRLEKARQRAEYFEGSLVELREGRSYRLMRVLWRLRRPFRRAPRDAAATEGVAAEDDSDPAAAPPGPPVPPPPETPPPAPRVALPPPPSRRPGEPLRVASVLDEMSAACFAPECDLVPLTLEGWREQLDERPPDLLLVESAWNGNGGEWQYRIAQYPRPDLAGLPALRELIDGCRERGIPTAFWNKEDPVHFDRFAEAASLFDHVFTTDAGCVERYRSLPGERTVAALPFAAQPRLHNPAAAVPARSSSPCFAGAWYRDRHPDRRRALEGLLDAARPHGLVIYDRRFGEEGEAFGFPDRFAPHVLGRLPYDRILDVYKSHQVFLNANSVVDSPTMCSRRVFELAACDTAILSTPGAALTALLGAGVVEEVADEASAAAALERLLGDEDERRRRTRAARRAVFAEHTYAHRLATIAGAAGLDVPEREGGWELVVQPGAELSEEALADLGATSVFAPADAIGAGIANGGPAPEHRPVSALDPRALLLRRELLQSRGRPTGSPEEVAAHLRRWRDEGVRLYAADTDLLEV